jgi:NAD(P)-dependent dehydrogenase (short-subunit alcohol dehydrogenase family)
VDAAPGPGADVTGATDVAGDPHVPDDPGVLVVVAAGPGLGLAVARRFAREGFAVGLVGRSPDRLGDLVEQVRAAGAREVRAEAADVADESALRAALGRLRAGLGDPTVLVFNGSAYVEGPPSQLPAAELRRALEVGVVGGMVAAQEVLPAMRAAGRGTVVLTGSVAAERASTSAAAVGVAKAALRSLTLSLHKEAAPDGVRVATVTVDGVLSGPRALDLDALADRYWGLHLEPEGPAEVRHPG